MTQIGWITDNRWAVICSVQSADEGMKVMDISRESEVDPGNVSKILDRFRNMELIRKDIHGEHYLTEEGKEVMKHLKKANKAMPNTEGEPA
jgi:Mn-dependent DtxR family transcriptional regulator